MCVCVCKCVSPCGCVGEKWACKYAKNECEMPEFEMPGKLYAKKRRKCMEKKSFVCCTYVHIWRMLSYNNMFVFVCTWEFKYKLHSKKVSAEETKWWKNAKQGKRTTLREDGFNSAAVKAMKAAAMA